MKSKSKVFKLGKLWIKFYKSADSSLWWTKTPTTQNFIFFSISKVVGLQNGGISYLKIIFFQFGVAISWI